MNVAAAPTILIVDSDPRNLTAIATALQQGGHECLGARDGEAAWKAMRRYRPELLICEIELPGVSGLELARAIRAEVDLAIVPLIFLSERGEPDVVARAHAAGGSYFLRKPCDPRVLVELVDKALWMPHLVTPTALPPPHTHFAPIRSAQTVSR